METLTSPSSAILVGDSGSPRSRDPLLRLPESFFRPSHWFARAAVLHLASARRRAVKPVFSLSPEPQMGLEEVVEDDKSQEADHSRTVHVKFQIQKECSFGDELLLVGDDPMLGLWDPDNGIPLAWSDDHVWTAEMDMPIGKTIQYKFVLKESDGTISWQPGPDRIFQSWETINIITVSEEWEDAENQKLIEDDGYTSPNVNSEVSADDGEKLYPKEELVSEISDELVVADDDKSYPDGKSMSATPEEPIKEKNPIANVADNVGNAEKNFVAKEPQDSVGSPEKDLVANEPKEVPTKTETVAIPDKEDKVIAKEPEEVPTKTETVAIPDKVDKMIAKDTTTRVAEVKNTSPSSDADKNRTRSVSSPVRVPGLSLEPKVARTQQAALSQQRKESTSADVSDEPKNDAKSSDPPELEKKHDLDYDDDDDDDDTHGHETTEMLDNGEEEEDQVNSELMKGFYGNDIIWGFRTVQKLLVNLGLA